MGDRALRSNALCVVAGIAAVILAAAFQPSIAVAQEDECDEGPTPRMVRVHGVVREVDGSPAAGRFVRFAPKHTGSPEATTGPDGAYSMDVDLRRPRWVEAWVDGVVRSRFFRIAAPEGATDVEIDIQLVRPLVLRGTITLPDGRPAADMTLKIRGYAMSHSCGTAGGGTGGRPSELTTDDQGGYRVGLVDGDQTHYDLYISEEGVGCIGPLRIITDIDHPEVTRDLRLIKGGVIEGTVIAYPRGVPFANVRISACTGAIFHGHAFRRQVTTDEDGRFRLAALPPGGYSIWAHADVADWGILDINPGGTGLDVLDGQTSEVEIRMAKEILVCGRVFGPDGSPVRHAHLEGMDVTTDGDGRYVYRIEPGHSFYGEPRRFPSDVSLAPKMPGVGVVTPVRVQLRDAVPQTVDFRLAEPGVVTGRVAYSGTGEPAGGDIVCLSSAGAKMFVVSDSDSGTFEIEDVPPGNYQIRACGAGPRDVAVRAGERLGPIEFTVEPNPLFTLAGHVAGIPAGQTQVLPDGEPGDFLLECLVAPAGKQEEARRAAVDWRPDGTLTIRVHAPPTGRWDVVLRAGFPGVPDVSNVIRDIDPAVSEQTAGLQFELGRGGTISGRVLTADGRTPLPWVRVEARPLRGDALLLLPEGSYPEEEVCPPEAYSDSEGHFSIGGLLPGRYEVSPAWDRQCFGYAPPVHVRLAEGEHRDGVNFRAPRDWP